MKTKVYYGDTDAGGVVYYANYLRWMEMARSDWLDDLGISVVEYARRGILFVVARVEIDYRVPAVLVDEVEIETAIERVRHVRFTVGQRVVRCADGKELTRARITVACLDSKAKIRPLPEELASAAMMARERYNDDIPHADITGMPERLGRVPGD